MNYSAGVQPEGAAERIVDGDLDHLDQVARGIVSAFLYQRVVQRVRQVRGHIVQIGEACDHLRVDLDAVVLPNQPCNIIGGRDLNHLSRLQDDLSPVLVGEDHGVLGGLRGRHKVVDLLDLLVETVRISLDCREVIQRASGRACTCPGKSPRSLRLPQR